MDSETALQVFRQRSHESLMEGMILRLYAFVAPLGAKHLSAQEARRQVFHAILRGIEADAAFADTTYLPDKALADFPDEMRALYADEFREVADRVKSSVNKFLAEIEEKHGGS